MIIYIEVVMILEILIIGEVEEMGEDSDLIPLDLGEEDDVKMLPIAW